MGPITTGGVDIILPADYAETANFTFTNFAPSNWLRIVAANYRGFGQRAYETDTMPTLTTPNDQPVFTCTGSVPNEGQCHHINLVGIKTTSNANLFQTYYEILFGADSTPPGYFPHDIVIQGCHVHGGSQAGINTVVGIRIDGNAIGIYDNYIDHFNSSSKEGNAYAGLSRNVKG